MKHLFEIKIDLHGCNRCSGLGRGHHMHRRIHRRFLSGRADVTAKVCALEQGGTVAGIDLGVERKKSLWKAALGPRFNFQPMLAGRKRKILINAAASNLKYQLVIEIDLAHAWRSGRREARNNMRRRKPHRPSAG
jgi:hypothetical protein